MTNVHSSRKIELAIRENINFMWLTSMTIISHNTIKYSFKESSKQVLFMLASEGLVKSKNTYSTRGLMELRPKHR